MALCRLSFLYNSPSTFLHPFPVLTSTLSPSLFYHPKPVHFTKLISPSRGTQSPYPFSCASLCSSLSVTMESPPDGYRRNVGICLVNDSKKIFLASRLDIPEAWQMPQGGVDQNENLRDAVLRELKEETGVTSAEILAEVPYWLTYDFPPAVREKLKIIWGSDWKGQAQKWFLLKFTGKDDEINLLGDGTEKPEFGEWLWMSPEQVVELAVEFKKPVYKDILQVFSPYLQGGGDSS